MLGTAALYPSEDLPGRYCIFLDFFHYQYGYKIFFAEQMNPTECEANWKCTDSNPWQVLLVLLHGTQGVSSHTEKYQPEKVELENGLLA